MIEKAMEKCADKLNVEYIAASAENSGLANESVDIIFGAWAGPRFDGTDVIWPIEEEFTRILKKDGSIWLFENYLLGEFSQMRGNERPDAPAAYFLKQFNNYRLVEFVPAYWEFQDMDEAKHICNFIFGENAINFFERKGYPVMKDNIAIFSRTK
jgi:ubiquinone/menaquinone biosynthesis C-methylase UbiE